MSINTERENQTIYATTTWLRLAELLSTWRQNEGDFDTLWYQAREIVTGQPVPVCDVCRGVCYLDTETGVPTAPGSAFSATECYACGGNGIGEPLAFCAHCSKLLPDGEGKIADDGAIYCDAVCDAQRVQDDISDTEYRQQCRDGYETAMEITGF